MDYAAYLSQLDTHGRALADAADRAGLDAATTTCPGWTVRDVVDHTGMVHRWSTRALRLERDIELEHAPEDALGWFRAGLDTLLDTLRELPPDTPSRAFLAGAPKTVAFWARRQAHETAIHRADAESALGTIPRYEREFGADGIAELLEGFFGRPGGSLLADPAVTLRVAPTDVERSWLVRIGPDGRTIERDGAGPADATLTGAAADLYADLWNRPPADPTRLAGDDTVLARWRELATVTWS